MRFTTPLDDIRRRGKPDVLRMIRKYLEQRFGDLKVLESSSVHVGMELVQADDLPDTLT